ncbi:GWxTD domain-containing protein [Chloracidobacterium thermophilum]|uniref:GWxTD domain-containing protein n=1 Tax=Chloracidobacterium thermophilum TaxID=458033 RepID=UPI001BB2DF41|nr:GWxTD domain-containing protein [Chloracidobacterium thermophilum]QUV78269.1 GWxTD domain-containing protein [Chloracidobacterium thermophilum]
MLSLKDIGRLVLATGLGIATALAPLATYGQEDSQPRKKKQRKIELDKIYQRWVNEDVDYIITPEERAAFKKLQTDEEREEFIEQFWLRRDPDPDTPENEYREEYYRRIAYANEKFTSGIPGWKTDRGASTSLGGRRIALSHVRLEAPTSARFTKVAERPRPTHSRFGSTGIWKASVQVSKLSLWTRREAASTVSPAMRTKKTPCCLSRMPA